MFYSHKSIFYKRLVVIFTNYFFIKALVQLKILILQYFYTLLKMVNIVLAASICPLIIARSNGVLSS